MKFFNSLVLDGQDNQKEYPVCNNKTSISIETHHDLNYTTEAINKLICDNCHHVYPLYEFDFLESNSYDKELLYPEGEIKLIKQAQLLTKKPILIIGGGGNMKYINKYFNDDSIYFSDLEPNNDVNNYIEVKDLSNYSNYFGAIVSRAVFEHFDKPIEIFKSLNKNLLSNENAYMIAAFPELIYHDFNHPMCKIVSHINLFSQKSLNMTCDKTGFKELPCKKFNAIGHGHPIHLFKKIKDL
jgi:hypothetical protein